MKYVYWFFLSILVLWETNALQDIFGFSAFWQYLANVIFVVYFAYLLNIDIKWNKLLMRYSQQKRSIN
ncbi:hypothetical protein [Amphibacillus cookii]|uniref:hypothetical protein n=1 Tax=Amphibacillus cookii TaxID=767787 RepID=UPI001956FA3F|nr:hypothetical protein [Amphibacillus cookii]MBM7540097.1 hypothetical protein [Amphibacillus cookii]